MKIFSVESILVFFFFNDTATTEIYTLSLHDALPILASDWNLANGIGGGARAGYFVTPRWQIEGDGSYAALDVDDENANGSGERPLGDDSYNYSTFAARLNYNIPFGTQTSFVVGA